MHIVNLSTCSLVSHIICLKQIESDNTFDLVFLDFWEPGYIPYHDVSCNIMTLLECMTGFGTEAHNWPNETTPEKVSPWFFGK